MMGEVIVLLLPFIIGSVVVPLEMMMIILLLNNPRQGLGKAMALVAGMTVVRLLQGIVFGLIFSTEAEQSGGNGTIASLLMVVLGILLLITAYKQWRSEPDADDPPPKWLLMLDSMTILKAFGIGAGLVLINGKIWVFTLTAIGVIEEAQLGQPSSSIAFMLYILLAQSLLLLAILVRILLPNQSKTVLEAISVWLTRNSRPIVLVVSLVFGVLFFIQGVVGLLK